MCVCGAWDVWAVTRIWCVCVGCLGCVGGDSDVYLVVILQRDDSADAADLLKRLVQTSPPPPYTQPSQFKCESLHPSRFTSESLRPRVTAALARHRKNRLPRAHTETQIGGGGVQ